MMAKAFAWMNIVPVASQDLSLSRDQKIMTLLPPVIKCPINFYHGVAFTAQIG